MNNEYEDLMNEVRNVERRLTEDSAVFRDCMAYSDEHGRRLGKLVLRIHEILDTMIEESEY